MWPICKSRMIRDAESERFDATIIPTDDDGARNLPNSFATDSNLGHSAGSSTDNANVGAIPHLIAPVHENNDTFRCHP